MKRKPYRYRGPQTWAAVREAYIAGETAECVGARFAIEAGTIHQRSRREGWSRTALAAVVETPAVRQAAALQPTAEPEHGPEPDGPPPTPSQALDIALAGAASHLRAGRSEAATGALRLGETLVRLCEAADRHRQYTLEEAVDISARLREMVEAAAERAAYGALTLPEGLEKPLCEWAYRWRAATFGPECAAADAERREAFAFPK